MTCSEAFNVNWSTLSTAAYTVTNTRLPKSFNAKPLDCEGLFKTSQPLGVLENSDEIDKVCGSSLHLIKLTGTYSASLKSTLFLYRGA